MGLDIFRLKNLRKKKGLGQQELADTLGVPIGTYRNWEQGLRTPDTITIMKLAEFFDVSTDYLFGREKEPALNLGPYLQAASTPLGDISKLSQEDLDEINEIIEMKIRKRLAKSGKPDTEK